MPTSHPTIGARPAKSPDAPAAGLPTTSASPAEASTPQHIPLLKLLQKPTPVFCKGRGVLETDDLADLVELLFGDNHHSNEFKAAALLHFIVKLEAVINRADPKELDDLYFLFVRAKVKLFNETLFFHNALAAFQAACLPDSVLHWNEGTTLERDDHEARLDVRSSRFELVPVAAANQPTKGEPQR